MRSTPIIWKCLALGLAGCGTSPGAAGDAPGSSSDANGAYDGEDRRDGGVPDGGGTASGAPMCSADGWCWITAQPQGNTLHGVWAVSPDEVWAVGGGGTTLHGVNGTFTWVPSKTYASLRDVWAAAANDVWAVGDGVISHWNGSTWSSSPAPNDKFLRSVWGAAANDVWAVGFTRIQAETSSNILHWDGTSWTSVGTFSNAYELSSVWGTAANDVWAVGSNAGHPVALHWDGSSWSTIPNGPVIESYWQRFTAVWSSSPTDVWFRAKWTTQNYVVHWNGTTWSRPTMAPLPGQDGSIYGTDGTVVDNDALWGTGPDDIWYGSNTGLHWNGTIWDTSISFPGQAMSGTGPNDIWAVSNLHDGPGFVQGTLLHWDGSEWTRYGTPSTIGDIPIVSMTGTASDDVWVIAPAWGGEFVAIEHWDGSDWTLTPTTYGSPPQRAWAYGPNDVWAYGGADLHWNGLMWSQQAAASGEVRSVWPISPSDIWAVSTHWLRHYDGVSWETWSAQSNCAPRCLPPEVYNYQYLSAVWGSASNDVWVAGQDSGYGGVLLHWDGATWTTQTTGTGGLTALWGASANDVWVAGRPTAFSSDPRGAVLHWDGSTWTPVTIDVPASWATLWGFASNDIWMVGAGQSGHVAHWDGQTWEVSPTGFPMLTTLWGPHAGDIWVVGQRGSILRHMY